MLYLLTPLWPGSSVGFCQPALCPLGAAPPGLLYFAVNPQPPSSSLPALDEVKRLESEGKSGLKCSVGSLLDASLFPQPNNTQPLYYCILSVVNKKMDKPLGDLS